MKNLIMLILLITVMGCKDKNSDIMPATPSGSSAVTFPIAGTFVSAPGESVTGNAKIVDDNGTKSLIFDEAFMASGPDLKVYLSSDAIASDYQSLGSVKSSSGMQVYALKNDIDFSKYKYVVIWCEKFTVRFGTAELK